MKLKTFCTELNRHLIEIRVISVKGEELFTGIAEMMPYELHNLNVRHITVYHAACGAKGYCIIVSKKVYEDIKIDTKLMNLTIYDNISIRDTKTNERLYYGAPYFKPIPEFLDGVIIDYIGNYAELKHETAPSIFVKYRKTEEFEDKLEVESSRINTVIEERNDLFRYLLSSLCNEITETFDEDIEEVDSKDEDPGDKINNLFTEYVKEQLVKNLYRYTGGVKESTTLNENDESSDIDEKYIEEVQEFLEEIGLKGKYLGDEDE